MEIADINIKQLISSLLKRKGAFLIIAIIVLSLFLARAIHRIQISKIAYLKNEINKSKEFNSILEELLEKENELYQLKNNFPTQLNSVGIVDRLTSMAKQRALSISSLSPQEIKDKELYLLFPFRIELADSNFFSIINFLKDLEGTKIFNISNVRITTPGGDPYTIKNKVACEIIVSAVSLKEE